MEDNENLKCICVREPYFVFNKYCFKYMEVQRYMIYLAKLDGDEAYPYARP